MARNVGIRGVAEIKRISIKKVLSVLVNFNQKIKPKQSKYKSLQVDENCTDSWEAFASVFQEYTHKIGKKHTTDIEGNNTLLRHRIRRAVRKTCCFSKKLENHIKAFEIVFFYINFGWI